MFHLNPNGLAITRLGSTALGAVEALQSTEGLLLESGAVQVMVIHEHIGQLGGISTNRRGQYILATAVAGRIGTERLLDLGFRYKVEKNGHRYWFRAGHTDFRNFLIALKEMMAKAI